MHAVICIFDSMNFVTHFKKLKPIIKFTNFEIHNYAYLEQYYHRRRSSFLSLTSEVQSWVSSLTNKRMDVRCFSAHIKAADK